MFMTAWNTCSLYGRYDLARKLDQAPTIDDALALIPDIMAELEKTNVEKL